MAGLVDTGRRRPALVVAGDDRQARDLAADLRALAARGRCASTRAAASPTSRTSRRRRTSSACASPRSTRCWTPPADEPPVVVVSAVALSEKVPDPALRPTAFAIRKGDLLDLDEVAADLVAAGYERVDQVDDRGQFAIRGGILDVFPATEDRAARVDLFDIEVDTIRWFSTFTQRSLGETDVIEIAPAAELAAEHRELAEIAALRGGAPGRRGAAAGRPLPRVPRPRAHGRRARDRRRGGGRARRSPTTGRTSAPRSTTRTPTTSTSSPRRSQAALDARARIRLSAIAGDQPFEFRAQAADTGARSLKEAETELEKLARSAYTTVVTWPRRGEGERAAYNLARVRAQVARATEGDADSCASPRRACATASSPAG